jgi:elongation factor Ts
MADITAQQVQALRKKTGLAMMECKKALVEAAGDEAKAVEILRKKHADKMTDRAAKETTCGRIGVYADENCAAVAEVRCETDFVATNDVFTDFANKLAEQCAKTGITEVDSLLASEYEGGRTMKDLLTDVFGKLKENMGVERVARIEGPSACYVHHNGRVGAAVVCDTLPGEPGRHACMHVASTPVILGTTREEVDAALIEKARGEASAGTEGKPEQIREKIVDGKMNKWFADRVLVEQPFVMDDKKALGAFTKENGFTIKAFLKYEVGG